MQQYRPLEALLLLSRHMFQKYCFVSGAIFFRRHLFLDVGDLVADDSLTLASSAASAE